MEIKITTAQTLKVLHILSWILFIGLCVEAGSFIFNALFTFFHNPNSANYFKLFELYQYDWGQYLVIITYMTIVGIMKALLFYQIVKILYDKKLDLSQPFNKELRRFIINISYLALGIGLFSSWGSKYTKWLIEQGVKMPDMETLNLDGAGVWLFMGVILLIIAQIFKRGIEIQTENELTI